MKIIPFSPPSDKTLDHPVFHHPEVQPMVRVLVDAPQLGCPTTKGPLPNGTTAQRVAESIKRWIDHYESFGLLAGREVNLFLQNWGNASPVHGLHGMFSHPSDVKGAKIHSPIFCVNGIAQWRTFAVAIKTALGEYAARISTTHFDTENGPSGWTATRNGWGAVALADKRFNEPPAATWALSQQTMEPIGSWADIDGLRSAVDDTWGPQNYRAMSAWSTVCHAVMLTVLAETVFEVFGTHEPGKCSNYGNLVPHPTAPQYPDPNHPRIVCRGDGPNFKIASSPVLYPPGAFWLDRLPHSDGQPDELHRSIIARLGASVIADRLRGQTPAPWIGTMKNNRIEVREYTASTSIETLRACRALNLETVNVWGDASPDQLLTMIELSRQ